MHTYIHTYLLYIHTYTHTCIHNIQTYCTYIHTCINKIQTYCTYIHRLPRIELYFRVVKLLEFLPTKIRIFFIFGTNPHQLHTYIHTYVLNIPHCRNFQCLLVSTPLQKVSSERPSLYSAPLEMKRLMSQSGLTWTPLHSKP